MSGIRIITPAALLSFPVLVTPRVPYGKEDAASKGEPIELQYSAQLIWHSPVDLKVIQEAIVKVSIEKWGQNKATLGLKTGALRNPLRTGNDAEAKGFDATTTFANAKSKNKPGLVLWNLTPVVTPDEAKKYFYPGSKVIASITVFAYDNASKGVAFGLNNLQVIDATLPRLDSGIAADKEFASVEGAAPSDLSDLE